MLEGVASGSGAFHAFNLEEAPKQNLQSCILSGHQRRDQSDEVSPRMQADHLKTQPPAITSFNIEAAISASRLSKIWRGCLNNCDEGGSLLTIKLDCWPWIAKREAPTSKDCTDKPMEPKMLRTDMIR